MATIPVRCECGASFERRDEVRSDPETGHFACPSCGRELASWQSAHHPTYKLVEPGDEVGEG